MFFLSALKDTVFGTGQIFLIGALGFLLVRKRFISGDGLTLLTRLVIQITLPLFIFCSLIRNFSFSQYPNWWIFPILSLLITALGLTVGFIFAKLARGIRETRQFVSLVAFQNSGWLPIPLVAALLPENEAKVLLIYIFMFLLGFNLVIWSFGVWFLSEKSRRNFGLGSIFSPPVIATLASLVFIALGLNRLVPDLIYRPLNMLGNCTLPLAMIVVGGNLGNVEIRGAGSQRQLVWAILAKLVVLPLVVLIILLKLPLPGLIKLLLIIQASMPAATSLSIICRHYKVQDLLITKGIFWSHIVSILTIPLILALFKAVAF